jgi:hypothetical protein
MFRWLFDTSLDCPGHDGVWVAWLPILFHGSNLIIAACYLAVPVIILTTWKTKREGISRWRLWMVLAFLPAQSASQLAIGLGFFGQPYRLITLLDCIAAVAVLTSVLSIRPKILHILKLPSREEIHEINGRLQAEILERELREHSLREARAAMQRKLEEAQERLDELVEERKNAEWWRSRKAALHEVNSLIEEIGANV